MLTTEQIKSLLEGIDPEEMLQLCLDIQEDAYEEGEEDGYGVGYEEGRVAALEEEKLGLLPMFESPYW